MRKSVPQRPDGPSEGQRIATLARFQRHRVAWQKNPAIRELYRSWYGLLAEALKQAPAGPRIELGSGPGFAREFIADLELTDLVAAPWHDRAMSADDLPFPDRSVAALVLFDVLHHLPSPMAFFAEASRTLMPGGIIAICDPYIGPLSYPIYKLFHDEPLDLSADVVNQNGDRNKDPFDSNQAISTIMFGRQRAEFERRFPDLEIVSTEKLAGSSYPASGGFSRPPFLLLPMWRALAAVERRLPRIVFDLIGFRMLVVLRKRFDVPAALADRGAPGVGS